LIFRRARPTRLSVLQPGRRAVRRRRLPPLTVALLSLAVIGVALLVTVIWPLG
jgi:hypothetical protein